jgi:hypothetical protein
MASTIVMLACACARADIGIDFVSLKCFALACGNHGCYVRPATPQRVNDVKDIIHSKDSFHSHLL